MRVEISAFVDNDTDVSINFPNFASYKEAALKASVTIDLGLKDIYLKADIFADPDFTSDSIRPTAYLKAYDQDDNEIADLDAVYDGEKLYFDIAGLYDLVGLEAPENENTMYYVEYKFFDNSDEPGDPTPVDPQPDEDEEESEPSYLPFELSGDFLGQLVGKITDIIDLLKDTVSNKALSIDVDTALKLVDGFLVKYDGPVYSKNTTLEEYEELLAAKSSDYKEDEEYTAAQITAMAKKVLKENLEEDKTLADFLDEFENEAEGYKVIQALLDDLYRSTEKYDRNAMIADIEEALAKFATDEFINENPDATVADKAQSVIYEITGLNISVEELVEAKGDDNVDIYLGLLEEGLGIELNLSADDNEILNFVVEIDLVEASTLEEIGEEDIEKYESAVEVGSKNENDEYIILNQLQELLDAYRALAN